MDVEALGVEGGVELVDAHVSEFRKWHTTIVSGVARRIIGPETAPGRMTRAPTVGQSATSSTRSMTRTREFLEGVRRLARHLEVEGVVQ